MKNRKNVVYKSPKAARYFFSNMILVGMLLLLQIVLLVLLFLSVYAKGEKSFRYAFFHLIGDLLSWLAVLIIINRRCNVAFKLAWVVPILLFPAAGGALYLIVHGGNLHKIAKKRFGENELLFKKILPPKSTTQDLENHPFGRPVKYLENSGFSVYDKSEVTYLASGEEFHEKLLCELEKAKEFIFVEFFIVHEGIFWDSILEVLKKKAANGVLVRVLYDGMGSLKTLPGNYTKTLKKIGIDAKAFQPFVPVISTVQNNRDHRKLVIVDGKVGFTGGINLSDEYINKYERFGHWKDSGVIVKGEAVNGLTRFFLDIWYTNHTPDKNPGVFFGKESDCNKSGAGRVVPYADNPLLETDYAKSLYLEMINGAKEYVYITTPYLVPGDDVLSAMKRAAKAGVDVRLITPFHGDKRAVHIISRSYYRELLQAGVRIFEYAPGFIHSKNMVCDDRVCSVGTSNLDYRSLYLHYECGMFFADCDAVLRVKEDHLVTEIKCTEIRLEQIKSPRAITRLFISIARLFEPLI